MEVNLQQKLAHILWAGGSPCSGKTSITNLLAAQYGLAVYHVDEVFEAHRRRVTVTEQPALYKWTHTAWNELWMQPAAVLLAEAIACYSEHLELVKANLLASANQAPLLVEGTSLLPDHVMPLLSRPEQGLWLVPTAAFQREMYRARGAWVEGILETCEQPEIAFKNWMDRDVAFGGWVIERVQALGGTYITVDGERTIEENAALVANYFGLTEMT